VLVGVDSSEKSLLLCEAVRGSDDVPLIGISGEDTECERLRVLGAGCDDHLYSGCGPAEVMARIDAVLRWVQPTLAKQQELVLGPLRIDPATREVRLYDDPVHLTRKEFELLKMIAERGGQVVKRSDVLKGIWADDSAVASRSLDTHVSSLRRKLGRWVCVTVRGYGLRLGSPAGSPADTDEAS
jgi:DNA-binding response OmpR family regulator